jgi:hypothetical protein
LKPGARKSQIAPAFPLYHHFYNFDLQHRGSRTSQANLNAFRIYKGALNVVDGKGNAGFSIYERARDQEWCKNFDELYHYELITRETPLRQWR